MTRKRIIKLTASTPPSVVSLSSFGSSCVFIELRSTSFPMVGMMLRQSSWIRVVSLVSEL